MAATEKPVLEQLIIGRSDAMVSLRAEVSALEPSFRHTVLVHGETGAGKDLVSRAIFANSPQMTGAFEIFDCTAIRSPQLYAELFGTAPGAFPGAVDRPGAVERARDGILFIDEISAMNTDDQGMVMRLIDTRVARRMGGSAPYEAAAGIIVSTNQNPLELLERGLLREDLYYRLMQDVVIQVPPLREHLGDVELLVEAFLAELPGDRTIDAKGLALLESSSWPGNVRQLRAVVRCAARTSWARQIDGTRLLEALARLGTMSPPAAARAVPGRPSSSFGGATRQVRRQMLREALKSAAGNQTLAGVMLGLHCKRGGESQALDLKARKRAHRKFSYWWDKLFDEEKPKAEAEVEADVRRPAPRGYPPRGPVHAQFHEAGKP